MLYLHFQLTNDKESLTNEKEEASIEIETLKRDLIEKIHECDTLQTQVDEALASKDTEVSALNAKLEETIQKYQVRLLVLCCLGNGFVNMLCLC